MIRDLAQGAGRTGKGPASPPDLCKTSSGLAASPNPGPHTSGLGFQICRASISAQKPPRAGPAACCAEESSRMRTPGRSRSLWRRQGPVPLPERLGLDGASLHAAPPRKAAGSGRTRASPADESPTAHICLHPQKQEVPDGEKAKLRVSICDPARAWRAQHRGRNQLGLQAKQLPVQFTFSGRKINRELQFAPKSDLGSCPAQLEQPGASHTAKPRARHRSCPQPAGARTVLVCFNPL